MRPVLFLPCLHFPFVKWEALGTTLFRPLFSGWKQSFFHPSFFASYCRLPPMLRLELNFFFPTLKATALAAGTPPPHSSRFPCRCAHFPLAGLACKISGNSRFFSFPDPPFFLQQSGSQHPFLSISPLDVDSPSFFRCISFDDTSVFSSLFWLVALIDPDIVMVLPCIRPDAPPCPRHNFRFPSFFQVFLGGRDDPCRIFCLLPVRFFFSCCRLVGQ